MKRWQVSWKLSLTVVTVEVITVTGREDRNVIEMATRNLKRDGINANNFGSVVPNVTLVSHLKWNEGHLVETINESV